MNLLSVLLGLTLKHSPKPSRVFVFSLANMILLEFLTPTPITITYLQWARFLIFLKAGLFLPCSHTTCECLPSLDPHKQGLSWFMPYFHKSPLLTLLVSLKFKLWLKEYVTPAIGGWDENLWTDLRHCCHMGSSAGTQREGKATQSKLTLFLEPSDCYLHINVVNQMPKNTGPARGLGNSIVATVKARHWELEGHSLKLVT